MLWQLSGQNKVLREYLGMFSKSNSISNAEDNMTPSFIYLKAQKEIFKLLLSERSRKTRFSQNLYNTWSK